MGDELLDTFEEDGAAAPQERDWKGIATALLVILFICSLIGVAILLFTPLTASTVSPSGVQANMTDLLQHLHDPIEVAWWFSASLLLFKLRAGAVSQLDVSLGMTSRVMETSFSVAELLDFPPETRISFDAKLVARLVYSQDRRSDPDNEKFEVEIESRNGSRFSLPRGPISLFIWAPTTHEIVYGSDGDLFYASSPLSTPIQITNGEDDLIHGIFDWMTQEEITMTRDGVWWSPSSSMIAFASRPIKSMKTVLISTYNKGESYVRRVPLAYPKVGEKRLPTYSLSIWNKETKRLHVMDVQLRDSTAFHYLFGVSWAQLHGQELLVATWANRWQNETSITVCSYDRATCSLVFEYKYSTGQWAEPSDYSSMTSSSSSLFIILPRAKNGNSFQHIARLSLSPDLTLTGTKLDFTSQGDFDVSKIVSFDNATDTIFYMAAAPEPRQRHVYASPASPALAEKNCFRCISCQMENCTWQDKAAMTADSSQLFIACRGPGRPFSYVASLNETGEAHKMSLINSRNSPSVQMPIPHFESLPLSSGYEAFIKMYLPVVRSAHLPLLVMCYGGPGSQSVTDSSVGLFSTLLSSRYALALIDVRGTGGRGWKYKSPVYRALGINEAADQLEAVQLLLHRFPFLDRGRVGLFGWSFGGFLVANIVESGPPGIFRCVIAGAPVTNFLFYDAAYTERYMGDSAATVYSKHDLTRNVAAFNGSRLLLLHGLRDDNVHFQNSAVLMDELQRKGVPFDVMLYPNQGHGISGRRQHLQSRIDSFLHSCFFH